MSDDYGQAYLDGLAKKSVQHSTLYVFDLTITSEVEVHIRHNPHQQMPTKQQVLRALKRHMIRLTQEIVWDGLDGLEPCPTKLSHDVLTVDAHA